ncbi:hypothetical protein GCM10011325_42300 [Dyadobacter sediminis]|nr:hypothetical protein GCM10011325_42300 [Dyadobacter sediminis]
MSSCSKDDLQTPQPNRHNNNSNLRETAPGYESGTLTPIQVDYFYPTNIGKTGENVFPDGWQMQQGFGISTYYSLGAATGYNSTTIDWLKGYYHTNIPKPVPNVDHFLTLKTSTGLAKWAHATTQLKNLIPGKKYEVTYYVSTYMPSALPSSIDPYYAKGRVYTQTAFGSIDSQTFEDNLIGKEEQWVKRTIQFTAQKSTASFKISALHPTNANEHTWSFLNVHLDSVKRLF